MKRSIWVTATVLGSVIACAAGCSPPTLIPSSDLLPGNAGPDPGDPGPIDAGRADVEEIVGDAGGPDFNPVVTQSTPPPPVSGGTLLLSTDGALAIAADADRDQVYVVELATSKVTTVALVAGDEPGRLVQDAAGLVHVVARGGGAVVTLNPTTGKVTARQSVCAAPRGLAYDDTADALYVACATGELVTLPAAGGAPTRTVVIDRDLRDVVLAPHAMGSAAGPTAPALYVTRMKTAELIAIGADGSILGRQTPPPNGAMTPAVAWRGIATASGQVAMIHQRGTTETINTTQPGGYGASSSGCQASIVESTITLFADGTPLAGAGPILPSAVLPVDIAESPDGTTLGYVAAGNAELPNVPSVFLVQEAQLASGDGDAGIDGGVACATTNLASVPGQPVAIAFEKNGAVLVQSREPSALFVFSMQSASQFEPIEPTPIPLSSVSRNDTGHAIFHSNSGAFIACASCHPEGLEDGRLWTFDTTGARRTQSLKGTLDGTAPYHWEGDLSDVTALMQEVFVHRMSGPTLDSAQIAALQSWLFTLPAPPTAAMSSTQAASAARGQALFQSSAVGCSTCHSGAKFTNNQTLSVNTGGSFQVPSLIGVAWRAPFLHDGCAQTLLNRFTTPCTDGVSHGQTANLSGSQIAILVSYLETL